MHKEVLGSVRQQPWSIRRKMKLVQQAKEYVKKHEGELQERLAMSKSTRDILARFHILVVKVNYNTTQLLLLLMYLLIRDIVRHACVAMAA